ncbi:hypothetical protein DKM44_08425 [Deinococcus irradiatisoli]|uniref:Uncharacterized protein n=1 Tax=Deinococcus irradiatisoli TaxID=2202254 RepID=A0A2Z3JDK1_9DEIO|nr:hypothetical protein [Deinococcus irradiatisoli]AWN23247.1 hypothetical protein DKM44_08425 [Deinococcus irradiatisoli]
MTDLPPSPEDKLAALLTAAPYWIAHAMQEQGSRFYQHLGAALFAADADNRRRIYQTWPEACWEFYQRGLVLQREAEGS